MELADLLTELGKARTAEAARVTRLRAAMSAPSERVKTPFSVPDDLPESLKTMAKTSELNYLPKVESTILELLEIEGIEAQYDGLDPWEYWQSSNLDALQGVVHQSALRYGAGFVEVRKGEKPTLIPYSARQVTILRDAWGGGPYPLAAVRSEGDMAQVWDAENTWILRKAKPSGLLGPQPLGKIEDYEVLSQQPHGMPVCPLVIFRDRATQIDEDLGGIIEPLINIQARLNDTQFQLDLAKFFRAFQQLYVSGFLPTSAAEELRVNVGKLWYFGDPDVKVSAIDPGPLEPYFEAKKDALHDLVVTASLSLQDIGTEAASNVNVETLVAADAVKTRRVHMIKTSLGESWETVFRLAGLAAGDQTLWADTSCEVRWAEKSILSFAQVVDGVCKLIAAGFDPREGFAMVPGMSEQKLQRATTAAATANVSGALDSLRQRAASAVSTADAEL